MIEQFLTEFYDCLHFSGETAFQAERFAELFAEHAILFEHRPNGFQTLTVSEFIQSICAFQKQMRGSFDENQIGFKVTEEEGVLIVDSEYEKKVNDKTFMGTNHMILTEMNGYYKIISIVF